MHKKEDGEIYIHLSLLYIIAEESYKYFNTG